MDTLNQAPATPALNANFWAPTTEMEASKCLKYTITFDSASGKESRAEGIVSWLYTDTVSQMIEHILKGKPEYLRGAWTRIEVLASGRYQHLHSYAATSRYTRSGYPQADWPLQRTGFRAYRARQAPLSQLMIWETDV